MFSMLIHWMIAIIVFIFCFVLIFAAIASISEYIYFKRLNQHTNKINLKRN